jgi:oligosaccharide repeat unit polymerase
MEFALALGLFALAIVSWLIFRSWVAPAVMYPAYWSLIMGAAGLIRIGDHHLSMRALLVFQVGALCFVLGAILASAVHRRGAGRMTPRAWQTSERRKRAIQRVMVAYGLLLIALIPFFVVAIRAAGAALGIDDFPTAARVSLGIADAADIPHYFSSATSLGSYLAYYAAWIYEGRRRDKLALGVITLAALAMSALTFGRSPIVALMVGVLSILWLRGRVHPRTTVALFGGTLVFALVLGAMLNKGPDFAAGGSRAGAVVANLAVYFVGGPVGFSEVMNDPSTVGEPGLSLRLPKQIATWAGYDTRMPTSINDYITTDLGNVYSFYYPYWYDAGWLGVLAATLLAGFFSTWIFQLARSGHPVGGASFGIVVSATLTSAVGDGLFVSPMQWILVAAVGWLLWHMPARIGWSNRPVQQVA